MILHLIKFIFNKQYRKQCVISDVMCSCGKYMDSEPAEGMPNLIRTEPTLTKKRDNLWEGAKEKLVGERGVNEPFD